MHFHGQKIRRSITTLLLGFAAFAGALLMTATSASAGTPTFALNGFNAAGSGPVQQGRGLTYVFTATNQSSRTSWRYLVYDRVANLTPTSWSCLSPSGSASLDGNWCEPPGREKPGQQAALVMTGTATGAVGTKASVRVCLYGPRTIVPWQCKTVSTKIVAAST